ncbi:MAG: CPBP family intramembrane metalloprotease, partial [Lachnospiraceae bacterium]|nr:CPBP family intramembrane metalloprotease [Lachnospiraceae bacterium]
GIVIAPANIMNLVISRVLSGSDLIGSLLYADDSWIYLIFGVITVGIVVPVLEELIFRRLVINATCKYGYGAAIMISAFTFGIYHGNFIQFFYAFGLGIMFAYIYCKTGKLRYTVLLHMGYNLYAALVIPLARKTIPAGVLESIQASLTNLQETIQKKPELLDKALDQYSLQLTRILENHPGAMFGLLLTALVNLFYFFLIFVGIILVIVFIKKALGVRKNMMLGQKGTKRFAAFNYGAILFYVLGVLMFGAYYLVIYLNTILAPLLGGI